MPSPSLDCFIVRLCGLALLMRPWDEHDEWFGKLQVNHPEAFPEAQIMAKFTTVS
jgi:hypothetical protein